MILTKNLIKDNCSNIIKEEWLSASESFPDFLSEIPAKTKAQNEQYVQNILDTFQQHIRSFPRFPIGRRKWRQAARDLIKDVLYKETIIGVHQSMERQVLDAFEEELMEFLRHVRRFAPELSFEDIGQAIRNYIVYAMFKEIKQKQTGFSKAGFGYSMLYPFTDNYIDSTANTPSDKAEYNRLIHNKIEGKPVHTPSLHHKKTCDLLQAIEDDYPRDQDSTVYILLLMMLEAQEESLKQQNKAIVLSKEERLSVSLYKGGISVLIDRFFVRKEITEADLAFYFGMGFFLQLADDLQDIRDDSKQGYQTIFTYDLHPEKEELLVNKMLHFIHKISTTYQAENDMFKNFVLSNCYQLVYTSLIRCKEFFSKEYIDKIEAYLPVTYSYFENFKHNLIFSKDAKAEKRYMKILDAIIF